MPSRPKQFIAALRSLADAEKAAFFPRFFKTGKGEYGEGDTFIGVTVPQVRSVVKQFRDLSLEDVEMLLKSPIHEARLGGLLVLVSQYQKADAAVRKRIAKFYLDHLDSVNNWDLVDSSAHQILGPHIEATGDTQILDRLAKTKHLWRERVAIVTTYHFIRLGQFEHTIRIAEILLHHDHDLIHKAVGWMLREMGKRDRKTLEKFLKKHSKTMPRTALRYAIEKFDEPTRKRYLRGEV